MRPPVHLAALSSLLAQDSEAGALHTRHLQVVAHLCATTSPMNSTTIAEALAMSASQLSRILAKLETRGLVFRTDPRHRPMLFAPTLAGRALDGRVRDYVEVSRTDRAAAAA